MKKKTRQNKKWVWYVKSSYTGDNAQGNVLGIFTSALKANAHYEAIKAQRLQFVASKCGRAKGLALYWEVGKEISIIETCEIRYAGFYIGPKNSINPDYWSERVELFKRVIN